MIDTAKTITTSASRVSEVAVGRSARENPRGNFETCFGIRQVEWTQEVAMFMAMHFMAVQALLREWATR